MAVLNCPECGGIVSSTTDRCVHCGCKFVVCPECGAASKAGEERCAACGYAFATETETVGFDQSAEAVNKAVEEDRGPKLPLCKDIQENWMNIERPTISKVLHRVDLFFMVLYIVAIAMFVIGMFGVSFKSIINLFDPSIPLGISAILFVISMPFAESDLFDAIAKLVDVKKFWNWNKSMGHDLSAMHKAQVDSIRSSGELSDQAVKLVEVRGENEFSLDTVYYNSRANGVSIIVCAIIKLLGYCLVAPMFSLFIVQNMHIQGINAQLLGNLNALWALILGVVIYLIVKLAMFIYKKVVGVAKEAMTEEIEKNS